MTILNSGYRKARKNHTCDGFLQIDGGIGWSDLAKEAGKDVCPKTPHKISKGEVYYYQTYADGGEIGTFKSCKHCYSLIEEYDLWDE